jgi:hypothetical protein
MGLFNLFKKKEVPDELPDLITDELSNKNEVIQVSIAPENQKSSEEKNIFEVKNILENNQAMADDEKSEDTSSSKFLENNPININHSMDVSRKNLGTSNKDNDNSGYFSELEDDLNNEITDLNKLEDWYKNKFLPRDIVTDMRKHWEGKNNSSVINILGRNFKDRINEKTARLQVLEKEWQGIYFDLIEKEEEIREQEKELKKMLAEFVELCKRKNKEKVSKKK